MSIYKHNFEPLTSPEIVSSDFFNGMFTKEKDEIKQIYEILYNLYVDTNILSINNNILDNAINNVYEQDNKTLITFDKLTRFESDELSALLSDDIYYADIDDITNYLVSKKIYSKRYNIYDYYDINQYSNNNTYLSTPVEIISNNNKINDKPYILLYKYTSDKTSITNSLSLSLKKKQTTEDINTIIINLFPSKYVTCLYELSRGKNKEKIKSSIYNTDYMFNTNVYNNIDYTFPYYLSIQDDKLDYMDLEFRNRNTILTDNNQYKSGILGIKNIYLESNNYASTSILAFKLKENIDSTKWTSKISNIKLNNKIYSQFAINQCQIRIYKDTDTLYTKFNTPTHTSNQLTYISSTDGIDISEMSDPIVCIVLQTNNIRSTQIVKNIEITWK